MLSWSFPECFWCCSYDIVERWSANVIGALTFGSVSTRMPGSRVSPQNIALEIVDGRCYSLKLSVVLMVWMIGVKEIGNW